MSEPAQKLWYQDGGLMLFLAGAAAFVYFLWFTPKQRPVEIQLNGHVAKGVLGGETFTMKCWHIHPGTLEKGRITVTAESSSLVDGETVEYHSFDAWLPNKEHQVTFAFPLHQTERSDPIRLSIQISAQNAFTSRYKTEWHGNDWSKPLIEVASSGESR